MSIEQLTGWLKDLTRSYDLSFVTFRSGSFTREHALTAGGVAGNRTFQRLLLDPAHSSFSHF